MTGYRSGFIAGDHEVMALLHAYRPSVGAVPQTFIQDASVAAWNDDVHVEQQRKRWEQKRQILLPALASCGVETSSDSTFFLWGRVPDGETSEGFAARLLEAGLLVAPGSYFGPLGEGFIRLALVPSEADCYLAARIIEGFGR